MERKDLRIGSNTVVHCVTEELANRVLRIAHDLGYKWCNDESYLEETRYTTYEYNTCYYLEEGKFADYAYCQKDNVAIISAEDFLELHEVDVIKTDNKDTLVNALAKIEELEDNLEKAKSRISHYQEKKKLHKVEITRLLSKVSELELKLSEKPKKEIIKFTLSSDNYDRMICKNGEIWVVRIFDSFHRSFWMDSAGHTWKKALPFNNETKKLISTPNQPDVEYKFVECLTDENK